ncbi:sensor histidine kinase [Planotetraspora sp. A-T 1434]|uniref:sensor histidine kinase n=1 Tax=Planotetraspora sp. A-T 1434 TaxID=2979219 RepID=UPI0021C1C5F8|nr:sensor histidine kinase [Planotetraspora sp. A-T 1434]MCT9930795.1 sensor histidine kinase [Planotetraspora sp. A-T 1434]
MHVAPPPPFLKRVPPGVWTTVTWCAGVAFTVLIRVRLPGESMSAVPAGVLVFRWDGLTYLGVATGLVLAGSALLPRRPLRALTLFLAASVIETLPLGVGEIPLAQFLAVDVALYFIASTRARRTGVVAVACALAVLAGYLTTRLLCGWSVGTSAELAVAMTTVIAWLVGHSVHQAREHAGKLVALATAQAVTDERLRISRELHDVVAHSIGVIALQAAAAGRVIETQPGRAREALGEIETVGREALSGLRRMVAALRQAEPGQPPQPAASGSAPGLADVDRLAATVTDAGVRVDVRWLGERRPLPADIDISAYRIIQEAVTNVVRHAGTHSCEALIDFRDDELSIEVIDGGNGRGRPAGSGYGLVGMRERVGLLRGEFSAAPRPEGGFRVTARLPLPEGVR